MTYVEAINFLFGSLPVWEKVAGSAAYKPGLERITAFLGALGNPHKNLRTVHIAGTNGKGSTAHMLAAVMQTAGLRTGLFTSPHLVDFRERIRVDGAMIPQRAVVEFTEAHRSEMIALGLTFFEMTTAMGLWWFEREGCDVAIIEAGLGGRLDSTNIITPLVSIITNIGLEHTQYLGDTVAKIAGEKAGIIKPSVPVVVGETKAESEAVFRARAAELHAPIVFADNNYELRITNYELGLCGEYQSKNLLTVLAAVDILRRTFDISDTAVRAGLANTVALTGLRGRWQIIDTQPLTVCDTAHNAHGFEQIARQIARQKYGKLYMILGFAGDKDLDAIIGFLPRDAHYILTAADTPRAMPVTELAQKFTGFDHVEIVPNVVAAVRKARSLASPEDMIYIGGSNFVVGEFLVSVR